MNNKSRKSTEKYIKVVLFGAGGDIKGSGESGARPGSIGGTEGLGKCIGQRKENTRKKYARTGAQPRLSLAEEKKE